MLQERWHQGKKQRLRQNKVTTKANDDVPQTSPINKNLVVNFHLPKERIFDDETAARIDRCRSLNYDHEALSSSLSMELRQPPYFTTCTAELPRLRKSLQQLIDGKNEEILFLEPCLSHQNRFRNHGNVNQNSEQFTTLDVSKPNFFKDKYLLRIVIVPYDYVSPKHQLSLPLPSLPQSLLASLLVVLGQVICSRLISSKCKLYCLRDSTIWLKKSSQHIVRCRHNKNNNYHQCRHSPCHCICIRASNNQNFQTKEINYNHLSQHNFTLDGYSLVNVHINYHHKFSSSSFLLLLLLWLIYPELLLSIWSSPCNYNSANQISTHLSILNYKFNDVTRQSYNFEESLVTSLSKTLKLSPLSSYSIEWTRIRTIDELLVNNNRYGKVRILGMTKFGQQHPETSDVGHMQCTPCNSSINEQKLLEQHCCSITSLQVAVPFVAYCLITALIHGNRRWSIFHFSPSSSASPMNRDEITTVRNLTLDVSPYSFFVEFTQIKLTRYNPSVVTLWVDAKDDHFINVGLRYMSNIPTSFDYQATLHLIQYTSYSDNNSKDSYSDNPSGTPRIKFDWHLQENTKFNYQRISRQNFHTNKFKVPFHSLSKSSSCQLSRVNKLYSRSAIVQQVIGLIDRLERRNSSQVRKQLFSSSTREKIKKKRSSLNGLMLNIACIWLIWNIITYVCVNEKHNCRNRLVKLCSCSSVKQNRSEYSLYTNLKNVNSKLIDGKNTRNRRMDIMVQKDDASYKEYLITDMCQWKSNLFVPTSNDIYFSSYEYDPARRVAMYKQLLDLADSNYQARYDSNMMRGKIFSPPTTSPSIVLKIPTKMSRTFAGYEQACGINLIAPTGFRILARIYGRQSEIRQDEDEDRGWFNVSYLEGKETHHMIAESRSNIMSFRFLLDRDNYLRDPNLRFHVVATAFTTTTNEDFARQPKRNSMFNCDHERLIDKSLVCDNFTNCEDGTDEDRTNCYLNPAIDSSFNYNQKVTTELYPGQTKYFDNDQTVPVSKLNQQQQLDQSSWTGYIYTTLKLIVLLLFLLLLTLFCIGLILVYRRRLTHFNQRQISDDTMTHSRGSMTSVKKHQQPQPPRRPNRNRFHQDSASKKSIFAFNRPKLLSPKKSKAADQLSTTTLGVASSSASMLPGGASNIAASINRPPTISSSTTSTLTRPVPAKRITKSPNQTNIGSSVVLLEPQPQFQQQQQPSQQTSRFHLQPSPRQVINLSPGARQLSQIVERFERSQAAAGGSSGVSKPLDQSINISYYHQSSMTRSFKTPSPGGSILVPSETMRTVYMQTDKRPQHQSGLPSSRI